MRTFVVVCTKISGSIKVLKSLRFVQFYKHEVFSDAKAIHRPG